MHAPTTARLKILIVDDVMLNRQLLISALKKKNIVFMQAENGVEALEQLESERPDLILMDMRMPVMDGEEATEKIKADERFRDIPIIAITTSVMQEDEKHYRSICDDFIRKPVNMEQLMGIIYKFYPEGVKKEGPSS